MNEKESMLKFVKKDINNSINKESIVCDKIIKIKLLCNWTKSKELREQWNKFTKGNYRWNNIEIVLDDNPDYFVVVNCPPPNIPLDSRKIILFQMEPYMKSKNKHKWGQFSNPDVNKFFKICSHDKEYNNIEWHLSKTYTELLNMKIEKTENTLSTVLSAKYSDMGHIKRVDFVKYLEHKNLPIHVYGSNKWKYKDYKGVLPSLQKR